jgi:hypothetical protein
MTTPQANQPKPPASTRGQDTPQDVQPESGTRDAEDETIRQSSAASARASHKTDEAPEEP